MRATGLAGLLAAFGIKLPEEKSTSDFSGTRLIIPIDEPIADEPVTVEWWPSPPQLPLVDLSSLRNVSVEVYHPMDISYHWDDDFPLPIGPTQWEASVLMQPGQFDAIGLSPDELMETKYRYRFALPFEERYFEGDGIVIELQPRRCGGVMWEDPVAMTIQGTRPLWVHL